MKCPSCGYPEDRVVDTRLQREGAAIRRRRECLKCGVRYSTLEVLLQEYPLVIKKDGRRESFCKEKVLGGIQAACQKRAISLSQMEQIVERVAAQLLQRVEREVSTRVIGEEVMAELKRCDKVAYVRFASVYREFRDVREFVTSLEGEANSVQINV